MIPFIILLLFTFIAIPVLYFYPPNIPLKTKMTLLGLAFLLATGGLFILDVLSYWLSVAAMLAIAFIASYLAEKRMHLLGASGEKTEIVLSFSEEEKLLDKRNESEMDSVIQPESAVAAEEIGLLDITEDNYSALEIENEVIVLDEEEIISVEKIEDADTSLINTEEVHVDVIEEIISEEDTPFSELSEEEYLFLTEGREFVEKDDEKMTDASDIYEEELISQRALLFDDLEELESVPSSEENIIVKKQEQEESHLISLDEVSVVEELGPLQEEEDLLHVLEEIHDNNLPNEILVEEVKVAEKADDEEEMQTVVHNQHDDSDSTLVMEETVDVEEIEGEDEAVMELPITKDEDYEQQDYEPTQEVSVDTGGSELPKTDDLNETLIVEVNEPHLEQEELAAEPVEEVAEETSLDEPIEMQQEKEPFVAVNPDMNLETQDMLLSTLMFYKEQGDSDSYQDMLHSILTQSISDKDFYLFSKLLLEEYLSYGKTAQSAKLLTSMALRLSGYSFISEELERYAENLFENE